MVDLPPPDGPTSATLRPGGTCRLRPRSTVTSGRDGYANLRHRVPPEACMRGGGHAQLGWVPARSHSRRDERGSAPPRGSPEAGHRCSRRDPEAQQTLSRASRRASRGCQTHYQWSVHKMHKMDESYSLAPDTRSLIL